MEHKADSNSSISWFHTSSEWPSLFTCQNGSTFLALLVYVDDVILTGNNLSDILSIKTFLNDTFKIKDLSKLKCFHGLEIAHSVKGINVCQGKYTLELLNTHGPLGCKLVHTPMDPLYQALRMIHWPVQCYTLSQSPWSIYVSHSHMSRYHLCHSTTQLIPRYSKWVTSKSCSSYPNAIQQLSQFLDTPTKLHLKAAHRILRYLKGSLGKGLFFLSNSTLQLKAFSNSDWVVCSDTRCSTTGYCIQFPAVHQKLNTEHLPPLPARYSDSSIYFVISTLFIPLLSLYFVTITVQFISRPI